MRNKSAHIVIAGAVCMLMSACVQRPDHVLSDSKMISVVADMELAEAYVQINPDGSFDSDMKPALVEYIIKKHGISRQDFDSTMAWYGRNPDNYIELYTKVDKEISRRRVESLGTRGEEHVQNSESDLWPYTRMGYITNFADGNAIRFSMPVSDIDKGSALEWRMRMRGSASGSILLGVEYDNGSSGFITRNLTSSKSVTIKLQTDTAMKIKRVFGNMMISDSGMLPIRVDSIYLQKLPYDSMEYYKIHSQRVFGKR